MRCRSGLSPLLCDYYNVSADYLLGRSKEKDYLGADKSRKLGATKKNG